MGKEGPSIELKFEMVLGGAGGWDSMIHPTTHTHNHQCPIPIPHHFAFHFVILSFSSQSHPIGGRSGKIKEGMGGRCPTPTSSSSAVTTKCAAAAGGNEQKQNTVKEGWKE